MKKVLLLIIILSCFSFLFFTKKGKTVKNIAKTMVMPVSYINEEGLTIASRIKIPEDYKRTTYTENSFQEYIRNYTLLKSGSEVINYDGNPYVYQQGHVGILDIPVPSNGLQQCADALIRIRSEYLWDTNQKEKIGFNFTSGHYCSWKKYAEGYRPKVNGSKVSFHKTASSNSSKENFYKYLNLIFMYSGTQSLYDELPKVNAVSELQIGDMLIYPGSPGHIIMIVDEIIDASSEKMFIFAQGNTPAQSVHILKNPMDTTISPWFEIELGVYFEIPTYHFDKTQFIRFK